MKSTSVILCIKEPMQQNLRYHKERIREGRVRFRKKLEIKDILQKTQILMSYEISESETK